MSMSILIDADFGSRKHDLLAYLRSRTKELLGVVTREHGTTQFKKRASADLAGRRDLLVRPDRRRQGPRVHVRDLPWRIQGSCPRVDHSVGTLAQMGTAEQHLPLQHRTGSGDGHGAGDAVGLAPRTPLADGRGGHQISANVEESVAGRTPSDGRSRTSNAVGEVAGDAHRSLNEGDRSTERVGKGTLQLFSLTREPGSLVFYGDERSEDQR